MFARLSLQAGSSSARLGGIALMLFAVWLFSFGDALGKFIVATYSVGQLLLFRAIGSLLLLAPAIWRHRDEVRAIQRPGLQVIRVVLSTTEVAAFFLAAAYLPLADVITYYLAAPIFVTALSALFLGEQVGWRRWTAIMVGFAGVIIALGPTTQTLSWPAMIALSGSASFAVLMILTRSLRGTPDIILTSAQALGTLVFGVIVAPFGWITPSLPDLGLFALAALISIGASLCVNRSLKLAPASVVTPYQYTMIIWAVVFGYVVFGDVPSIFTLIGAAIIVLAGLYIFLRERSLAHEEPVVVPPPG